MYQIIKMERWMLKVRIWKWHNLMQNEPIYNIIYYNLNLYIIIWCTLLFVWKWCSWVSFEWIDAVIYLQFLCMYYYKQKTFSMCTQAFTSYCLILLFPFISNIFVFHMQALHELKHRCIFFLQYASSGPMRSAKTKA